MGRLMNARETAKKLRIHVNRIYELVSLNKIPFKRVTPGPKGALRFDEDEIDRWDCETYEPKRAHKRTGSRTNGPS
jgi:excisionase family DNA binding protein